MRLHQSGVYRCKEQGWEQGSGGGDSCKVVGRGCKEQGWEQGSGGSDSCKEQRREQGSVRSEGCRGGGKAAR